MKLEIVNSWNELPESAISLMASSGKESPFLGEKWFQLFSQYVVWGIGKPRWLFLADGAEVHVILAMVEEESGGKRILRSLSNYYSPYFDVISRSQNKPEALAMLLKLAQDFLSSYDVVDIAPLTRESRDVFIQAMDTKGFYGQSYLHTINWQQRDICSFDEYWPRVSSRVRQTVKRRSKKLNDEGGFKFSIVSTGTIEPALLDYHEVYFKSWKIAEPYPSFIDAIARRSSEDGTLRLGLLHKNDAPIAAQIWFVVNRTAYIFKLAYDPKYADYSVGTLLTHYLLKEVILEGSVHTIDYLTGDDAYKRDWMDYSRELYGIRFSNLRTLGGVKSACRDLGASIFNRIKAG